MNSALPTVAAGANSRRIKIHSAQLAAAGRRPDALTWLLCVAVFAPAGYSANDMLMAAEFSRGVSVPAG